MKNHTKSDVRVCPKDARITNGWKQASIEHYRGTRSRLSDAKQDGQDRVVGRK